jgi:hypothetical protein
MEASTMRLWRTWMSRTLTVSILLLLLIDISLLVLSVRALLFSFFLLRRVRTLGHAELVLMFVETLSAGDVAGFALSLASDPTTTESGGTAILTVTLSSQPAGSVTVILSTDTGEGTLSASSVVFFTGNWDARQTVTVTGMDDDTVDGNVSFVITGSAVSSSDTNFHGDSLSDVTVTNTDGMLRFFSFYTHTHTHITGPPQFPFVSFIMHMDTPVNTPTATVSPTSGLVTTEAGGVADFSLVLDSQPYSSVTIAFSSTDTTEGVPFPSYITFGTINWDFAQSVTVTGMQDDIVDSEIIYAITTGSFCSSDTNFHGEPLANVAVTNTDGTFSL